MEISPGSMLRDESKEVDDSKGTWWPLFVSALPHKNAGTLSSHYGTVAGCAQSVENGEFDMYES